MLRTLTLSAATAALLAFTPALAQDPPVANIEVDAPLAVLETAPAGSYWANLETDLSNAIAARIVPAVGELPPEEVGSDDNPPPDPNAKVTVRIESFALSDSLFNLTGADEGELAGQVILTGPSMGEGVSLRVSSARPMIEGEITAESEARATEAQYRVLVDTFADRVAELVAGG